MRGGRRGHIWEVVGGVTYGRRWEGHIWEVGGVTYGRRWEGHIWEVGGVTYERRWEGHIWEVGGVTYGRWERPEVSITAVEPA